MEIATQFLRHTPWWVYALFFYLLGRGLAARKPAEVSLQKLAIIPVLLTVWSLSELVRLYGPTPSAIAFWAVGLLVGIAMGWNLLSRMVITVDVASGAIQRPADFTLLPLVLMTFAIKYAFGAIAATQPAILQEPALKIADLGLSGLFSGIFVGKFALYASRYRAAGQ